MHIDTDDIASSPTTNPHLDDLIATRVSRRSLLVGDPDTGEMRRFLTGPRGCEITGVITTPVSARCS